MNILWVKDNNIGHEKQVKNLLDEISKKIDIHIDERLVKGFFPFFTYLENVEEKKYDLIIGAGHKTYSLILETPSVISLQSIKPIFLFSTRLSITFTTLFELPIMIETNLKKLIMLFSLRDQLQKYQIVKLMKI